MAEGSSMGTYVGVGIGSTLIVMSVLAMLVIRRMKSNATKRTHEGTRIINNKSATWYDPKYQKLVPEQVGPGDVHVEEGLLSVLTPEKRTKSAECLLQAHHDEMTSSNLMRSKQYSASSQSLSSFLDEKNLCNAEPHSRSQTLRSAPHVEFNLQWASVNSTLTVYVTRINSLPPSYCNATCTYRVTLNKPDKTTISRSSNKVRKVNLNPDCFQLFTYPVLLEEVQRSELVLEVCARKSKHLISKPIGSLHYELPRNLTADKPISLSRPLTVNNKKGCLSAPPSPKGRISGPSANQWGELQVLAQYQVTGGWQDRIKVVVLKAQNNLNSKGGGSYKVEMVVKKGEETQTVFQTKSAQGPKPLWKTPFIFDVAQTTVNEYRVELNLHRVFLMKKSTPIGQAVLGLNTTESGTQHWQDLVVGPNKEITSWHPITYPEY